MANNNETTTKFKADISELKKNFQEAQRQIRLANSEFKAATSGMDKWSTSADGISAKLKQLNSVLEAEKKKLESLEDQYKQVVQEQGENSKGAEELKIKINNQKAAIGETEKQIKKYNDQLTEMQAESQKAADSQGETKTAMDKLKDTIGQQKQDLAELKEKYSNLIVEQKEGTTEAQNLAQRIDSLSTELNENRDKLNQAENAADEFDNTLEDVDESADNTANGGLSVFTVALGNLIANVVADAISKLKDIASETINVGKEFEKSMSNVAALSGATGEELEKLSDTAKKYGSTTQFSASEAADALSYMALAGWDANQSCDALGGVLDLAGSSGMGLADASDMVTDYLSAFGMEAKESSYFADMLAYAQANSNTTASALGEAYKNCAASMNAAGQDIETTTSFLATLANQGLKGSEAGTVLTATIRDMTRHMSKVKDETKLAALASDGYASSTGNMNDLLGKSIITIGKMAIPVEDANGNFRDLTDIMKDVEKATDGMGTAERTAALSKVFMAESVKGVNMILNAGVGEAADFEEQLRNSTDSAKNMASAMNDNLDGGMKLMKSNLENLQIAIYEKLEPALRAGVDILNKLIDAVSFVIDHSDEFIAVLTGMATALGTYLAYTTIMTVMTQGWQALTIVTKAQAAAQAALNAVMSLNPIGLVIAAVLGLVAAFAVLWNKSDAFKKFWINLWEKVKKVAKTAWKVITKFFSDAWKEIKAVWNTATEFFANVWEDIKEVFSPIVNWFKEKFEKAWNTIKIVWNVAVDFFSSVWEGIKEIFEPVAEALSKFFSDAWEAIKIIWDAAVEFFSAVWEGIKAVFEPVAEFFKFVFELAWTVVKFAWDSAVTFFEIIWTLIKEVFEPVADWFSEKFQDAWDKIKEIWSVVTEFFSDIWEGIKEIFSDVAEWFLEKFEAAWNAIKEIWSVVVGFFEDIWEGIQTIFFDVGKWFKGRFSDAQDKIKNAWNGVTGFFSDSWDGIKNIFKNVGTWFSEKFNDAWKKVKEPFEAVGEFFGGIWNTIKDKFTTVGTMVGDAIGGAFKTAINGAIGVVENALNWIPDKINPMLQTITDWTGVQLPYMPTIDLPRLAKGGVLRKGQLGLLEGDGAEAVVPLEKNTRWLDEIAKRLSNKMNLQNNFAAVGSQSSSVINNFYQTNNSPKALSRLEIYRQSKNLLQMKGGS